MHRRAGIAGLERKTQSREQYAALSNQLSRAQVDHLQTQLERFRTALQRFATDHRDDIRRDPAFRTAFTQMCASIGVDPLAGPKRGGWWAELLGLGDWQYELGVQICDVCIGTRERNGGMIDLQELIRILGRLRGTADGEITEDDVARSIRTLAPLGAGYEIVVVGARKMVRSVPKELDTDQNELLQIAQDNNGNMDEDLVVEKKRWTRERAQAALDNMLNRDGMCWVDEQDPRGRVFWVPSVMTWEDN